MLKFVLIRFTAIYICTSILLGIIAYFIDAPSSVSAIIIVLAPYITGMLYHGKYETIPENSFAWKCATYFALIALLVSGLFGFLALQEPDVLAMVNEIGYMFFFSTLGVITLLQFLIGRWAFMSGIKQNAKVKAAQEAKNNTSS